MATLKGPAPKQTTHFTRTQDAGENLKNYTPQSAIAGKHTKQPIKASVKPPKKTTY